MPSLHDQEADDVTAGADGQVDELDVVPRPTRQRLVPGQLEESLAALPEAHRETSGIVGLVGQLIRWPPGSIGRRRVALGRIAGRGRSGAHQRIHRPEVYALHGPNPIAGTGLP